MNRDKFISYLDSPGGLDKGSLEEIRGVLEEYPYFQTAHMLLVKALGNLQDVRFSSQLKFSAAHIGNRHLLFNLVNQPGVKVSISNGQPEEDSHGNATGGTTAEGVAAGQEIAEQERTLSGEETDSLADKVMKEIEEMKRARARPAEESPDEITVDPDKPVEVISSEGEAAKEEVTETATPGGSQIQQDVFVIDEKADIEDADRLETGSSDSAAGEEDTGGTELTGKVRDDEPDLLEIDKPGTETGSDGAGTLPEGVRGTRSDEKKNQTHARELSSESHSFSEWLDLLSSERGILQEDVKEQADEPAEGTQPDVPQKHDGESSGTDLIERFLKEKPRIQPRSPLEYDALPDDMSEKSIRENEEFFTETLARIYVQQKHYKKAIYAYEKLCLKYPEKYSYFADRIDEIKRFVTQ
ncbi:MAG: hypothetical protein EA408_04495 [Marinilabiliales bacterium]|nr:MAG: hypothetical protein EA408_04495 [Marinilabiliales bacterium]